MGGNIFFKIQSFFFDDLEALASCWKQNFMVNVIFFFLRNFPCYKYPNSIGCCEKEWASVAKESFQSQEIFEPVNQPINLSFIQKLWEICLSCNCNLSLNIYCWLSMFILGPENLILVVVSVIICIEEATSGNFYQNWTEFVHIFYILRHFLILRKMEFWFQFGENGFLRPKMAKPLTFL